MGIDLIDWTARNQRSQEVLLGYLQAARVTSCPWADGLTLHDALTCYRSAMAAGQVPDLAELLRRHPELANELESFFACQERRPASPKHNPVSVAGVREFNGHLPGGTTNGGSA
jgi:hypothetical protein